MFCFQFALFGIILVFSIHTIDNLQNLDKKRWFWLGFQHIYWAMNCMVSPCRRAIVLLSDNKHDTAHQRCPDAGSASQTLSQHRRNARAAVCRPSPLGVRVNTCRVQKIGPPLWNVSDRQKTRAKTAGRQFTWPLSKWWLNISDQLPGARPGARPAHVTQCSGLSVCLSPALSPPVTRGRPPQPPVTHVESGVWSRRGFCGAAKAPARSYTASNLSDFVVILKTIKPSTILSIAYKYK